MSAAKWPLRKGAHVDFPGEDGKVYRGKVTDMYPHPKQVACGPNELAHIHVRISDVKALTGDELAELKAAFEQDNPGREFLT